jgi:hypothetical protein
MPYIIAQLNGEQLINLLYCYTIRVIFKKHILYGITNYYKPCDSKGNTYNVTLHFGNDRKHVTLKMTPTAANVTRLTVKLENVGHKLHMENFPSPVLLYDFHTYAVGLVDQIENKCLGISDTKFT